MRIARQLVVFLKRPGGQSQFSTLLEAQSVAADPFAELHDWVLQQIGDPNPSSDQFLYVPPTVHQSAIRWLGDTATMRGPDVEARL